MPWGLIPAEDPVAPSVLAAQRTAIREEEAAEAALLADPAGEAESDPDYEEEEEDDFLNLGDDEDDARE